MQKVEGSNPFSRFEKSRSGGVFISDCRGIGEPLDLLHAESTVDR
jgi:hypothetical protein